MLLIYIFTINFVSSVDIKSSQTISRSFPHLTINTLINSISRDGDDFLIAAKNYVIKINSSLYLLDWTRNGPVNDSLECMAGEKDCKSLKLTDQNNHLILNITPENGSSRKLVSCGTIRHGMCFIHEFENLSNYELIGDSKLTSNYISSRKNTIALKIPSKISENAFIIAREPDEGPIEFSSPVLSMRYLKFNNSMTSMKSNFNFLNNGQIKATLDVKKSLRVKYPINFVFAYANDRFIYIISNQQNFIGSNDFGARIGRVCIDDVTFNSYTELQITCNHKYSSSNFEIYNIATAAYVGSSNYLMRRPNQLFVAFSSSLPGEGMNLNEKTGSVICSFELDLLEKKFNDAVDKCFAGDSSEVGLHPAFETSARTEKCTEDKKTRAQCSSYDRNQHILHKRRFSFIPRLHLNDTKITSLAVYQYELKYQNEYFIALIGSSKGQLVKAILSMSETLTRLLFRDQLHDESDLPILPNPVLSKYSEFAMIGVSDRIVKFPTKSCSIYSCYECVKTTDPLSCGWCGSYCASPSECSQTPSRICSPVIFSLTPKNGPLEGGTNIIIRGDNFVSSVNSSLSVKFENSNVTLSCDSWNKTTISCTSGASPQPVDHRIEVTIEHSFEPRPNIDYISEGTGISEVMFNFIQPILHKIRSKYINGSFYLSVKGDNLDIGSRRKVLIGHQNNQSSMLECDIVDYSSENIFCQINNSVNIQSFKSPYVIIQIDNKIINRHSELIFKFPSVKEIYAIMTSEDHEVQIKIVGSNLDLISKPILKIVHSNVSCVVISETMITCPLQKFNESWYNCVVESCSDGKHIDVILTDDGCPIEIGKRKVYLQNISQKPNNWTFTYVVVSVIVAILIFVLLFCSIWINKKNNRRHNRLDIAFKSKFSFFF